MNDYEVISRLDEIYDQNKWSEQEYVSGVRDILERVAKFVLNINADNRPLIMSMIEKYHLSRFNHRHAYVTWERIRILSEKYKSVLILPVIPVGDQENSSGVAAAYDVMNALVTRKPPGVTQRKNPYEKDVNAIKAKYVLFIDDFIASGSQFLKMYNEVSANLGSAKVGLYAFVIQAEGEEKIRNSGIEVFSELSRGKAITDGFAVGSMPVDEAMAAYLKLEALIAVPKHQTLGDRKMEALVTMRRTPNSTLPIFWCENGAGGKSWPAPFVRT